MNGVLKLYPLDEVNYSKMTAMQARVLPWAAVKGDDNLRVDYDLRPSSLVYDVGGYHGDWAKIIDQRYGCRIKIFEPVKKYVDMLNELFGKNNKIEVFPYGLGGSDRSESIGVDNEASSVFKPGQNTETIDIKDVSPLVRKDQQVDLMKMNIEGGEYELLESLIKAKLVANVKSFQIQFHDFVPDAKAKRQYMHEALSKTHHMTFNYPFIWEGWDINE